LPSRRPPRDPASQTGWVGSSGIFLFNCSQCCGSGSAWVHIILVTGSASVSASNKNSDLVPHPDPHQIKIRIRICIQSKSWIRNRAWMRINLQITNQNVWNMSLFGHIFKGLSLYLEARIWIRIRVRVKTTRQKKVLKYNRYMVLCVCWLMLLEVDFRNYFLRHCFICRPTDSTVSEDAGIESRPVLEFLNNLLWIGND
jgi:hypothetical protein